MPNRTQTSSVKGREGFEARYLDALESYRVRDYLAALKRSCESLHSDPLSRSAWALMTRSLAHILLPGKSADAAKLLYRSCAGAWNKLACSIDFFIFRRLCLRVRATGCTKKILFTVPWMKAGGGQRVILNIVEGIDRSEYDCYLITSNVGEEHDWQYKFETLFRGVFVPTKRRNWKRYVDYLVETLRIDMVLTTNSGVTYNYLPHLRSKFPDVKVVDILHAEESFGCIKEFEWVPPFIDRRICISAYLKDYMEREYDRTRVGNGYRECLRVLYNGIDVRRFSPDAAPRGRFKSGHTIPDGRKVISYIGRTDREKRPLLFVEIARRLLGSLPENTLHFVMAGDGELMGEVREMVDAFGLNDHLTLTGTIDNVDELLADTDILLVVSRNEGIPFVILEAMAMGVPVISTDVGAIGEVIKSGVNGYLIDRKRDVCEEFVSTVTGLLSDDVMYQGIEKRTREEIVSRFSLEAMSLGYQKLFKEVLNGKCPTEFSTSSPQCPPIREGAKGHDRGAFLENKSGIKRLIKGLIRTFGLEITRYRKGDPIETRVVRLGKEHGSKGAVLLSYRIEPFVLNPDEPLPNSHMNYWRSLQMAKTFLDLGYSVDAIDFRNKTFMPDRAYSVFIDVRWNLERLAPVFPHDCVKIMHIDTSHTLYHNAAECRRLLDLQQRRGVTLRPRRFEMPNHAIEHADCATIAANEFTINTFRYAKKPLYRVPQSPPFLYPWPTDKNFDTCRKNFLWFGSGGFVHKGLDLVLEAFAGMPDYHLTVCGPLDYEKDFTDAYRRELFEVPNIHARGWIDVGSREFIEIARQCIVVVSASCSEGGGGSTITCMHAGVIPIVSYETSVDVEDFGVMLSDCTVGKIQHCVREISERPSQELEMMAREAWVHVRAHHTREKFEEEYGKVIRQILTERGKPL